MQAHRDPKVIFQDALELPVAARAAHLDRACGGDAGLRARVEALLDAHAKAGTFLTPPAGGASDGARSGDGRRESTGGGCLDPDRNAEAEEQQ